MKLLHFFILSIILFSRCEMGEYNEPLTGNYKLSAPDEKEAMSIYVQDGQYWVGVVNSTVFAVGYDNEFIIAKQHPRKFPNPPDRSIVNYFIIPLKLKVSNSLDENRIGPLTKEEFELKRNELGLPNDLKFTKVFKELK